MADFIQNTVVPNLVPIVIVAIIVVALIVHFIKYRENTLKKAALYAVAKAEEAWGSNTGKVKFAEAYSYLKAKYPIVTFFISEDKLSRIIEEALKTLKEMLSCEPGPVIPEEDKEKCE